MIRLAVRCRSADAERVLAELLEVAPSGVEEVSEPDGQAATVEYAVYGAPGELPDLGQLRAAVGGALVDVTSEVLRSAAGLASARVRTLDAVHLASALRVEPDELVAYDRRLLEAAAEHGIVTSSPGAP